MDRVNGCGIKELFKVATKMDDREAAGIARRKTAEDQRRKRFFNPRERMFGKDYDAIRQQMKDKIIQKQEEKQREEQYLEEVNKQDAVAFEFERKVMEDKVRVAKDLVEYRKRYQKFENRREFDLNDPNLLKNSPPPRLDDHDLRCGMSSIQRFVGEDLNTKEHKQKQMEQFRESLNYQINEKLKANEMNRKATEFYHERLREMDNRSQALSAAEKEARRQIRITNAIYNRAMACENERKKSLEKEIDENASMAHIINMCNSELLTETQNATSVLGPNRVCSERYKGYHQSQMDEIREIQKRQIEDKRDIERLQRQQEHAYYLSKKNEIVAGFIKEMENIDKAKCERVKIEHANMELAREQKLRQQYLNNVLYKGTPTDQFFDQFNTSSR